MRNEGRELALRLREGPRPETKAPARSRRADFLDFSLLYLFSYDIELGLGKVEFNSPVKGPRLNLQARTDLASVYHVWRESTVPGLGLQAITGTVLWGADDVALRADDVTQSEIRVSILTDDRATIHLDYSIVGYLGPGGARRFTDAKGKDRMGEEHAPFEFPIVSSPRFSTASHKYRWLNDHQGISFGRGQAVKSTFRRVTWDVYVFT